MKKAESLRWIGRAAAQYARWNRLSDQFDFLVNDLFPAALKLDADYWPAHFEAGLLFMEKYNRADAAKEFQAALEINPLRGRGPCRPGRTGDGRLPTRSGRGLAPPGHGNQSPACPPPGGSRPTWPGSTIRPARPCGCSARKLLPLNPLDESTLARIAACYLALDVARAEPKCQRGSSLTLAGRAGFPCTPFRSDASPRFDALAAEVVKRNPHAGEFYAELAEMLEVRNKQAAAERYFREAIRLLPRQPEPHAGLGLLLMRMGREADARTALKEAFDADPFHVRVKNSLDVLDVLDAMQTARTPHFLIKYDKADARLIPYLARHLETVYGEFRQQFGYEPPGPTLVEIFNESQGQSGHAWFSARMIGLPYLETVAASTGRIVAMVSPGEMRDAWQLRLGPHAEARDDPRLQSPADRLQHPALVYRGPGGL